MSTHAKSFVKNCTCCGKGKHSRDRCPAQDVVCFKCRKWAHYGSMCLSKRTTTDTVEPHEDPARTIEDIEEEDDDFLGAVTIRGQTQLVADGAQGK